jgi:hypothetical protein
MSRCARCSGFTRREPARVVCLACGREHDVVDASDGALWLQYVVDFALRPRSLECLSPGEDGWWPSALVPRQRCGQPVTVA